MLLISAVFLTVSPSHCCASFPLVSCDLVNWIFPVQLFVGGMGGTKVDFRRSFFFFFKHMKPDCVLCGAANPLSLQTRLSPGGFLPPQHASVNPSS